MLATVRRGAQHIKNLFFLIFNDILTILIVFLSFTYEKHLLTVISQS